MKTFNEYIETSQPPPSILNYDGSFNSNRREHPNIPIYYRRFGDPSVLNYDASFNSMRKEDVDYNYEWEGDTTSENKLQNEHGESYDGDFHDHESITPKNLSDDHLDVIAGYCSSKSSAPFTGASSSHNLNNYCRNTFGAKHLGVKFHDPESTKHYVSSLLSVFDDRDNTNREDRHIFSGIPSHIAKQLTDAGPETEHILPGFTSASSDSGTALFFGAKYKTEDKKAHKDEPVHVLRIHAKPQTFVSLVKLSPFSENEVLLRAGQKIKYHGSTIHRDDYYTGRTVIVHHVTAHSGKHVQFDDFGKYDHPTT